MQGRCQLNAAVDLQFVAGLVLECADAVSEVLAQHSGGLRPGVADGGRGDHVFRSPVDLGGDPVTGIGDVGPMTGEGVVGGASEKQGRGVGVPVVDGAAATFV